MTNAGDPLFISVGDCPARLFGLPARDRSNRLAANAGFELADAPIEGRSAVFAATDYAWDPAWLKALRTRPATVLVLGGKPVMAHVPAGKAQARALADFTAGKVPAGLVRLDSATAQLNYAELRKRERPFVLALDPTNPEPAERAAYDAAYKGVTDVLTLYLWRGAAFYLTRWAARAGLTPNFITAVGALGVVAAFWLFWIGEYWLGVACGFGFMVLDTVDGKLARCTGASSKWGNVFDHGIDLIHPPFWWWAWAHGLVAYGRPLEPVLTTMVLSAIIGGYVLQRLIEGIFMRRFGGMHIHVWHKVDSQFRLVTARRNPNMVLLVGALLFERPDIGLELVAAWTLISLIFHAVRLAQANEQSGRG
ncbi:MAG: CDP-alcohol phosphatidyltransferase family protein, partial [Sphingomicrobium sp.]